MAHRIKQTILSGQEAAGGYNYILAEVDAAADFAALTACQDGSVGYIKGDQDSLYIKVAGTWSKLNKSLAGNDRLLIDGISPYDVLAANVLFPRRAELEAIDKLTTRGDLLTRDATGYARLPLGDIGQVLYAGYPDPFWRAPGTLPISDTNNVFAVKTIDGALDQLGASAPFTWAQFRAAVRQGTIGNFFAVGDQFSVTKGDGTLVLDIVDIGSAERNVAANGNAPVDADYFTNFPDAKPVTFLMHDVIYGAVFDAPEANYKITTQINSGAACNITLESATIASATYDFTAPSNLIVGGRLRIIDATHLGYYSTPSATVVSINMAAGAVNPSIAASLSTQSRKDRVSYGSNKYTESAVRQYLNAAGAATTFWVSKSDYDLAPSWNATWAGFLNGLDADLLAVIGETTREVELNTATDGGGQATISDKVFLPSRMEIYGSVETAGHKGLQYQAYVGLADINKIKYDSTALSTSRTWWLRSPNALNATNARSVNNTTGALDNIIAYTSVVGAAAACVIL